MYKTQTELKARLFDLTDEKAKVVTNLQATQDRLTDALEELDDVRGQLNAMKNIAEKRGDMVRELVRDNRELKRKLQQAPAPSESQITEIREDLVQEIVESIKEKFGHGNGWNF